MQLFKKLFSERFNKDYYQHKGFYIIRAVYGEKKAVALFKAAENGDDDAQLMIAECFLNSAESACAIPWCEMAAKAGNSQAFYRLACIYEGNYMGIDADLEKAEWAMKKSLELNNPDAILKLGHQYAFGDGVEKDAKKAFDYYMKAAKYGSDAAMTEIGLSYLKGEVIEQNNVKAFEWFSKSEDGTSCYYLSQCYFNGIGTTVDMEKGVFFLEKAVDKGCMNTSEARKQLIDLYADGYGGANRNKKAQKIRENIEKVDELISELAAQIIEEEAEKEIQSEMNNQLIIALTDEVGNTCKYELLDYFEYGKRDYAVFFPSDDEISDEVVILQIEQDEDGNEIYVSVDEELTDKLYSVFKQRNKENYDFLS